MASRGQRLVKLALQKRQRDLLQNQLNGIDSQIDQVSGNQTEQHNKPTANNTATTNNVDNDAAASSNSTAFDCSSSESSEESGSEFECNSKDGNSTDTSEVDEFEDGEVQDLQGPQNVANLPLAQVVQADQAESNGAELSEAEGLIADVPVHSQNELPVRTDDELEGVPEQVMPVSALHNVKPRKRCRNQECWNVVKNKNKRAKGEPYVPGKVMGPPCPATCRLKCSDRVNDDSRQEVFKEYYTFAEYTRQRDFIHANTDRSTKKVNTTKYGPHSRRSMSITYFLPVSGSKVKVCKQMFLNTLQIKKGVVDIAMSRRTSQNTSPGDRRGKHQKKVTPPTVMSEIRKHIERFPATASHYCCKDSKRKYLSPDLNITIMYALCKEECQKFNIPAATAALYRKVFSEEYNLGFHRPKKDQCRQCMTYHNATDFVKSTMEAEYQEHLLEKNSTRDEKKKNKEEAQNNPETSVCVNFDLQQVLLSPHDPKNNALFYKRRLSSYNFTIYNVVTKQGKCFMWHEGEGGRGSCEIASCLLIYLKSLPVTVRQVVPFSDKCGGQNLNRYVAAALLYAVQVIPNIDLVDLKFHTVGHSEMESDAMHSAITTEGKRVGHAYWPRDWQSIALSARRHSDKPYDVMQLETEDIKDWKQLVKDAMVVRKEDDAKLPVNWLKIKWLRFQKERPLIILFKKQLSDEFRTLNTNPRNRRPNITNLPKPLYPGPKPIAKAKYNDLLELCNMRPAAIPLVYQHFYRSLPFSVHACEDEEEQ